MKKLNIAICMLISSLLPSCIEPYDDFLEDTDNEMIVVEGQIIGDTECEFIIQQSFSKNTDYGEAGPRLIPYASVYVICSDGQVYGARMRSNLHYYVKLGELNPKETYHLMIQINNGPVYESEPMYPMVSPGLNQVTYKLAEDDGTVQIRINNDDPHAETYYLWTYDEHWEVNTPLVTEWRYDNIYFTIVKLEEKINRGWCSESKHKYIVGNNLNHGNGALKDYEIYSLENTDNRFNTRYHTKVHQLAISKAEYEYYKQMEAQSTQTGGIFTLMPAQLPSNIHNDQGLKAQGYIGVHQNSSEAEIYINRIDVGYRATSSPEIIPDSIIAKETWLGTWYNRGYRVYHYNLYDGKSEWTRPWCIDCRDPYWGASLKRPDFWQDN